MTLRKTTLATALALSCGLSMLAYAHSGATGIVKERMDFFKQNKDSLKAIKTHVVMVILMRLFRLLSKFVIGRKRCQLIFQREAMVNHPKHHHKSGWIFLDLSVLPMPIIKLLINW